MAQSFQESDSGDVGAPDAAVYKSHSGDIVDTLQDLMDKAQAQLATADLSGVQAELDAVNEHLAKLEKMCIAKPDTYVERKRRREAELAVLLDALKIFEG